MGRVMGAWKISDPSAGYRYRLRSTLQFVWLVHMFVPGYVGVCEFSCKMGRVRETSFFAEGGRANWPSHCNGYLYVEVFRGRSLIWYKSHRILVLW